MSREGKRERVRLARTPSTPTPPTQHAMRFRFCGGEDCPDWLGSEIATLSKVSSIKVKMLTKRCVTHMVAAGAKELANVKQQALKLCKGAGDGGTTEAEAESVLAVLHHVLASAAKFDVETKILSVELQQLGLPREHSDAITRPYNEGRAALREAAKGATLKLEPLAVDAAATRVIRAEDGTKVVLLDLGEGKGSLAVGETSLGALVDELEDAMNAIDEAEGERSF